MEFFLNNLPLIIMLGANWHLHGAHVPECIVRGIQWNTWAATRVPRTHQQSVEGVSPDTQAALCVCAHISIHVPVSFGLQGVKM